jgi:molybdate transport system regulatory protein
MPPPFCLEYAMDPMPPQEGVLQEVAPSASDALARAVPRLRIVFGDDIRLGPGKIDLVAAVARTGSIAAAGRELGMSYRRAWLLIDEINRLFRQPVVLASAGGTRGGGAQVTPFGLALVEAYRRIESRLEQAIREELGPFAPDIVDHPGGPRSASRRTKAD